MYKQKVTKLTKQHNNNDGNCAEFICTFVSIHLYIILVIKLCCSKPIAYVCTMLPCGKHITWAHWAIFAPVIIDVLKYSLDLEDATV